MEPRLAHRPHGKTAQAAMLSSTRRALLASVAAGALGRGAALSVPRRIQAFCIDFNWRKPRPEGWLNDFAKPGHWASASPEEHVAWYQGIGANTIQTFCVSTNGYAWYQGGAVPAQPGLQHDFLRRVAELGHRKNMLVMGYFCAGANTKWGLDHPDLSYGSPSDLHIPYTDRYIDYLCRSIEDAVRHTGIDGYMLDWLWNPNPALRKGGWIASEQKLFEKLAGEPFPKTGQPAAAYVLSYERAAIERCWSRIYEVTKGARRNAIIWLSCSKLSDPAIAETRVLKQADWVLNEAPNREYYEAGRKMAGSHTRLIQCLAGWTQHDAKTYLSDPQNHDIDMYGFAEPRDNSLPLAVEEYLGKPISAFRSGGAFAANDVNIAALARYFRGLPMNYVGPRQGAR